MQKSFRWQVEILLKITGRTEFSIESKADESPVTIADKKAEELMREMIMKQFPEHGILGEEFGEYNSDAEYKWILDPIDGTKSFICGTVTFGTLIAPDKKSSAYSWSNQSAGSG